ncbi:unnamed protein product [Heligmosomoides polygyrus]|uniref:BTB domain-containing protein n=1 Tax=Heligmosomoides polygyrus TaxID=6339 RepID=A0A3P8AN19_HELPZ|nr:unnamed protein product [Heligmosomoides polygyrus]
MISCCESCERRRGSFMYDGRTEDEQEDAEESDSGDDEEEKCFECRDSEKEHVHDVSLLGLKKRTQSEHLHDTPFKSPVHPASSFCCASASKRCVLQLLANMYFNKIVLPAMEYVEDFVDFLIDAELNDLPVLKRACERYLCGELNTKKDLLTSLLLDLLFISIVFQLPVMKSMTLSELSNRTDELSQPDKLMEDEEYKYDLSPPTPLPLRHM